MIQYLINASIIWLAGLVAYDLLFSRERFHSYNRAYLLLFITAGLLLPMLSFKSPVNASTSLLGNPAAQVYDLNSFTATVTAQQKPANTIQNIVHYQAVLWILYFTGLAISLLFIARETRLLYKLYRDGTKQKENGYIIIETGKQHGPFSFFNIIFVGSRHLYNPGQWTLLTAHEQEHSRRWHSLDKMLLILIRSIFWFHPLPYIYCKRLMMVHEYQADKAAGGDITAYGHFLLEQNLLQHAPPTLTHTLNYSPIKKRIAMLTNPQKTKGRLLKYLAILPLFLLLMLFCSKTSFSEQPAASKNKIIFKDNEIELAAIRVIPFQYMETINQQKAMFMQAALPDSVLVKDFVNGGMKMLHVTSDIMPVALNGKRIYGNEPLYWMPEADTKYTPATLKHETGNLEKYLFAQLEQELNKLPDGGYNINVNRLVIDDQGNIGYYEPGDISVFAHPPDRQSIITDQLKTSIKKKLIESLESAPQFTPAIKDGKPINVRLTLDKYEIVVKSHQAQLIERTGC